ncbi:hypothetical protein [Hydrogenibacillus schlegelii]|nr:hypothetical protein [Hydrogenibacillus schlegelii]
MTRRPPKRPIRPVVGEYFTDLRTPETELFGEETALRPAKDVVKPASPKKIRRTAVRIPDEALFRLQKWKRKYNKIR